MTLNFGIVVDVRKEDALSSWIRVGKLRRPPGIPEVLQNQKRIGTEFRVGNSARKGRE
jgi:hypothetical protein